MPPSSQETPQGPRKYCAIAPHLLKEPNRRINDPPLVRFAQLINSEIRLGCTVCLACYQNLMKLYRVKVANARLHQKRREASGASMSDVSSSQRMESSPDSNVPNPGGVTMRRKQPTVSPDSSRGSSTSSDDRPGTSAAAAAKRSRAEGDPPPPAAPSNASYVSDDDDANSNLSLNAVNGTRLPHIQPIPKRRDFVHLNKKAMEIYMQGITGG